MTDNNQKPIVPNYIPDVGRLVTDRYDFQSHVNGTAFNHTAPGINLSPLITIQSIQYSTVQDAIAALALIISPNPTPNATTSSVGLIQLSGDIGGVGAGTATSVKVTGLQGRPVSILSPSTGEVMTWSGVAWTPTALTNSQGPASGDLSGTYPNPTVIALRTYPVAVTAPTTGQFLGWNGSMWTPTTISLSGDVTGTNSANTTVKLQGNSVKPGTLTVAQDGYALIWKNSDGEWEALPGAANLARGWTTNVGTVGPVVASVIVASVTVTPAVTGKIRVRVTGYASHVTGAPASYHAFGIYITRGSSLGPADFTQFLGLAQASTGSDGDILATIAYQYDYDKLSSPILFSLGTPVTFNVILLDLSGNEFMIDANGIQFEVQEIY